MTALTCTAPTTRASATAEDAARGTASLSSLLLLEEAAPEAAATALVVTDSSGTLKNLVTVLNTDSARPVPASSDAPARYEEA